MTQSPSNLPKYPTVREVERELRKARDQLNDALWNSDEELKEALLRQIKRLELLKEVGEKYDTDF
jgi:hypothetical protein